MCGPYIKLSCVAHFLNWLVLSRHKRLVWPLIGGTIGQKRPVWPLIGGIIGQKRSVRRDQKVMNIVTCVIIGLYATLVLYYGGRL